MGGKVAGTLVVIAFALAGLGAIPTPASASNLGPAVRASSAAPARTSAAAVPAVTAAAVPGMAIGAFERITARFGNPEGPNSAYAEYSLYGWAADPDAPGGKINVDIYLNGESFFPVRTEHPRPDVQRALPWAGPNAGWTVTFPSFRFDDTAIVCAYAINNPAGGPNTPIGCIDLLDPNPNDPIGTFETASAAPGQLRVTGWAGDPDGYRTTKVRVYYDDDLQPVVDAVADRRRADVKAAFPRLSTTTGFDITLPITPGQHTICLYAQNTGASGSHNLDLGCVGGVLRGARAPGPHDPRGRIDRVAKPGGGGRWNAQGWAYDPDTGGPVQVRVRVLAVSVRLSPVSPGIENPWVPTYHRSLVTVPTGIARPDVESLFPAAGPNSGYDGFAIETRHGRIRLACAYAVNVGPGSSRFIGCFEP